MTGNPLVVLTPKTTQRQLRHEIASARDEAPILSWGRKWKPICTNSPEKNGKECFLKLFSKVIRTKLKETRPSPPFVSKIKMQLLDRLPLPSDGPITAKMAKTLLHMVDHEIIATGHLELWDNNYPLSGEDGRNFVKFLLSETDSFTDYLSTNALKALFVRKDLHFLRQARSALQEVLDRLSQRLERGLSKKQEALAEIFIGNILSLLPFFEPQAHEILNVPQKINGAWKQVDYQIEPIQLTDARMGSPFFAYGLKPCQNEQAMPLLLFMGTPFPTASGALVAYWNDCAPFYSVGEIIYSHFASEKIRAWVNQCQKELHVVQAIKAFGLSLGGSLALLAMAHLPTIIREVHAYNPAALNKGILSAYKQTCSSDYKPDVRIYWQENDLIPLLGDGWDDDWKLIRIFGARQQNPYFAHIRSMMGHKEVFALLANTKKTNNELARKVVTLSHQVFSIPLFALSSAFIGYNTARHFVAQEMSAMRD